MNTSKPDPAEQVALFPLNTVLFPGGMLPLRIFETRYVDMISDCMRRERPFGVIPISHGSEVGATPRFHGQGTLAMIHTWDQGNDGLLHILARGEQPFRIVDHEIRDNGLLVGSVELREEDHGEPAAGQRYLGQLLDDLFNARSELAPPRPWPLDSAAWIAYRLAELIPLSIEARLEILALQPSAEKLALVANLVEAQNLTDTDAPKH